MFPRTANAIGRAQLNTMGADVDLEEYVPLTVCAFLFVCFCPVLLHPVRAES